MENSFQALTVDKKGKQFSVRLNRYTVDKLPDDDVLIRVRYSDINYKDGLAGTPDGKIIRTYPFIPGIDLAGEVVSSRDPRFHTGDSVIATGYDIGVTHFGGYSEYVRMPGDWLVPLPKAMTFKQSMFYGTAGFTAALAIQRLEDSGLTPSQGKVLVTGATGGVGSLAIAMLSKRGYRVVAESGKAAAKDYLKQLGTEEIIPRFKVNDGAIRPLAHQQWAAAVDTVGGSALAVVLSQIKQHGSVAACGNAGGNHVPATIFPFILRGVSLVGIDSVYCPMSLRLKIWHRLTNDLNISDQSGLISKEITLRELPDQLTDIIKGKHLGRTLVKLC
ncbi:oxidoreductase [Sporolactobacillus vineae]|uniref:oxidoreductase n=1 Tax=Sporolactobacillus vineae TaxID=444463 RepID=UPI000287F2E3|nr:oxidoreductase [Sporolactobacillus vineae]